MSSELSPYNAWLYLSLRFGSVKRGGRARAVIVLVALATGLAVVPPALAEHTVVTSTSHVHLPSPWNGFRVYLSSPRHADSGSRGECGWEENINGRNWNIFADHMSNALLSRRYYVTTSANNRNNGASLNKDASNNWGANVHIVTHSNAVSGGCGSSTQYLLVMYHSPNASSVRLKNNLISTVNGAVPGGANSWNCDTLIECNSVIAVHRAYVELFFHTNPSAVTNWYQAGGGHGEADNDAWLYGYAVDLQLGYPR